jgi:hypothetical protein
MDNVQTSQEQRPQALDVDEAADALLKRWEDAGDQLSEQATEEATAQDNDETKDVQEQEDEAIEEVELDDEDEEIDPDEEEEETEDQEEDDEEETVEVDDDTLIEISVEGETKQASIKDLKRLYGQEASLTRKSQEVAAQRKEAEDNIGKTDAILQRMVQKAEERYQPYSEVDMILASKNLDDADFAQLRKEAQDAHNDLKFIKEEANSFYDGLKQQQQAAMQDAAKEAVKVLEQDIPEWNNQLYDDIRSYAIGLGLPEEQVNNYVDPVVIKVLNKARLYDQAKQVTTTKKKRVAKKVLKSNKSPANNNQLRAKRIKDAEAKLAQSAGNDIDDIAEVLLKRWET